MVIARLERCRIDLIERSAFGDFRAFFKEAIENNAIYLRSHVRADRSHDAST